MRATPLRTDRGDQTQRMKNQVEFSELRREMMENAPSLRAVSVPGSFCEPCAPLLAKQFYRRIAAAAWGRLTGMSLKSAALLAASPLPWRSSCGLAT